MRGLSFGGGRLSGGGGGGGEDMSLKGSNFQSLSGPGIYSIVQILGRG